MRGSVWRQYDNYNCQTLAVSPTILFLVSYYSLEKNNAQTPTMINSSITYYPPNKTNLTVGREGIEPPSVVNKTTVLDHWTNAP